jgi:type I restriction enzyme S subunit
MGLVRLDEKRVVPRFFLYQYISPLFRDFLSDRTIRGATVDRISIKEFPAFPITVPPLPEQQRIVGILDEAFDGIATAKANAEKNLQNARALFESHLQEVFTRSGEGWVQKRLSDICTEITVGHVGLMAKQYKGSGIPFLRSQNIRPFRVTLENVVFIDEVFHSSLSKSQLRPGDLAIVRTGYPGTAAVIPDTLKTSNCSDLVIVRPGNHVDPHYLAAFFNSSYGKGMVIGKLVGAAQRHFNVAAAKNVLIHLPPLTEQRGVVSAITASRLQTQRLESIYRQKLAALDSLKKSLLDQAFNGLL